MDKLKRLFFVVNPKSLTVAGLAVLSTYLCRRFNLLADFPLTLNAPM